MSVVASASLTEALQYKQVGKAYRLISNIKKDGSEGKLSKEFLYINLETTQDNEKLALSEIFSTFNPIKSIIKMITLSGELPDNFSIPDVWKGRVFYKGSEVVTDGMVNLISVEGSPNLKDLYILSQEHPTYRYVGGKLLAVEGVPVGRFDEGVAKEVGILGKELPQVLFEGSYDSFEEKQLALVLKDWGGSLVTEEISSSKIKSKRPTKTKPLKEKKPKKVKKSSKGTAPKQVKVSKKKEAFSKLFSQKVEF